MVLDKVYNYSNEKLKYGFLYINKAINLSLSNVLDSVKENVVFCDTNSYIIDDLLPAMNSLLNNNKITVIGLMNEKSLAGLKGKGLKNGFFRSTTKSLNAAVIIVDKQKYYVAFDSKNIYEMENKKAYKEVFDYINHLIWTTASSEFCQGDFRQIKESRLSVVKPSFQYGSDKVTNATLGTDDIDADVLLSNVEKNYDKPCRLIDTKLPSAYMLKDTLYVNLFEDKYYGIMNFTDSYIAESFENEAYGNVGEKDVWFNGKHIMVKKEDEILKKVLLPLDEYKSYEPNFDEIAKSYNGFTTLLKVKCEINPIELDSSYKIHPNYSNYKSLDSQVSNNLERLLKLDESKINKVIKKIQDERSLSERIRKYNEIIKDKEFGVEALVDKKNAFKQISFKEDDIIIPSDIIGKLYFKDKKNYLALKDESKIDNAKKWLKENNLEAVLILGKED